MEELTCEIASCDVDFSKDNSNCPNPENPNPYPTTAILIEPHPQNLHLTMASDKPYIYQSLLFCEELQSLVNQNFNVVMDEEVEQHRDKIRGIFVHVRPDITENLIKSFPNLKVIGNCAVGHDNIDLAACKSLGVRVGYTPDVLNKTTADMGLALMLSVARRVVEGDKMSKDPEFSQLSSSWFGYEVSGMTAGIIGLGRIGYEVAKRLKAFNMTLLYHNRNKKPQEIEDELQASYVSDLPTMLSQCDYVFLVAPAMPSTLHLMSDKEFSSMKKSSIFINISRGSLVNQDALVRAVKNGYIAGAGLDVTDPEPLPRDHPLLCFPNVVITPHTGSATLHTRVRMVQLTIDNMLAVLRGEEMPAELKLNN